MTFTCSYKELYQLSLAYFLLQAALMLIIHVILMDYNVQTYEQIERSYKRLKM